VHAYHIIRACEVRLDSCEDSIEKIMVQSSFLCRKKELFLKFSTPLEFMCHSVCSDLSRVSFKNISSGILQLEEKGKLYMLSHSLTLAS